MESSLGSGSTYSNDLHKVGKKLFKSKFQGVFPADQIPRLTTKKPFVIVNLDTSDMPGSHWVSLSFNGKSIDSYDSFGRPMKKLLPNKTKFPFHDSDKDPEQKIDEESCGPRSLAWLYVYHNYGRNIALKI